MRRAMMMLVIGLWAAVAAAQDARGPGGPPRDGDGGRAPQSLTVQQKAQVKAILSSYRVDSLTAAEAKAINEAFRDAGLRNGAGLQEAMREAGFEPRKIGELDPPPDRLGREEEGVDRGGREDRGDRKADSDRPGRDREGRKGDRPPREGRGRDRGGQGGYSIEQAVSDRAQLHTIAFDGLAFLTGGLGCNTFLPPGKVADFCGFQYMRDVDVNQLGHNTSFVPRAANNILHVLNDAQKAQLVALAKEQEQLLTDFACKRFPLVKAFCRQLEGDFPAGTTGLSREAVMKYAADLYEIDGLLSYRRAQVLGGIVRSLSDKQKEYLAKMKFNDSSTWPELENQYDRRRLSHTAHVAVMTYASELFSWYAGSVAGDVYFCPERHATYFGSFYMKDIPAMGNRNYSISTSLTGDSGEAFLEALNPVQRKLVTGLVEQQRADLTEIVQVRRQIATMLRLFMKQDEVDKDKVMALSRRYGELDGEISYYYAVAFAEVAKTLTPDQKKTLLKLRNLDAKYDCKGAFIYSRPIGMPEIPNTDFLFGKGEEIQTPARRQTSEPKPPAASATPGDSAAPAVAGGTLVLRSPALADGRALPKEFTGDGEAATPPLEWSGAPAGTKSFALIMHHVAPDQVKWYWVLYNIPADAKGLPRNVRDVGILGSNSVNERTAYAPPRSRGPGKKTYVLTLYALSDQVKPDIEPAQVNRTVLLAAMKDKILATAELRATYSRDGVEDPDREEPRDR